MKNTSDSVRCREWYWRDVEHAREINRQKQRRYRAKNIEKVRARERMRKRDPIKSAAWVLLNNAVKTGKIERPSKCEECGVDSLVHGHHDDYSKPLSVKWLCIKCHGKKHSLTPNHQD